MTRLIITEGQSDSLSLEIFPYADEIHVLTGCERYGISAGPSFGYSTHEDGALISRTSPAQPGEVIVVRGFGFGQTDPTPPTGDATPVPAPQLRVAPGVQFDFRVNAGPSRPVRNSFVGTSADSPVMFAGLARGKVGLYQMNIKLPDQFPAVEPCSLSVDSNLTITVSGTDSYDGAAICVQVEQ